MNEFFPYFVALLAFVVAIFALHRRSVNEEMRSDYKLRTHTQSEREDLERQIQALERRLDTEENRRLDGIAKIANVLDDADTKIREEFRDNDQKLQHRIAAVENIISSRKFG